MNNDFPKMVFRAPGSHEIHGHMLDYTTVDGPKDLETAKKAGWFETTPEAVAAYEAAIAAEEQRRAEEANMKAMAAAAGNTPVPVAPPTRAEMELKAKELGIAFTKATTDVALLKAIDDKLAKKE